MKESISHIAAALKAARLKKGLSQRTLSGKTHIPQNHISRIENGEVDLQTSSLIELSRSLDLELMLVPKDLVLPLRAMMKGISEDTQIPKYAFDLDSEEEA